MYYFFSEHFPNINTGIDSVLLVPTSSWEQNKTFQTESNDEIRPVLLDNVTVADFFSYLAAACFFPAFFH